MPQRVSSNIRSPTMGSSASNSSPWMNSTSRHGKDPSDRSVAVVRSSPSWNTSKVPSAPGNRAVARKTMTEPATDATTANSNRRICSSDPGRSLDARQPTNATPIAPRARPTGAGRNEDAATRPVAPTVTVVAAETALEPTIVTGPARVGPAEPPGNVVVRTSAGDHRRHAADRGRPSDDRERYAARGRIGLEGHRSREPDRQPRNRQPPGRARARPPRRSCACGRATEGGCGAAPGTTRRPARGRPDHEYEDPRYSGHCRSR